MEMNMRNEDAYYDDDMVVPDGASVKVPIVLMDGVQRRFAAENHQPHFAELSDEQQQRRARTRTEYVQQLSDAWRSPATGGKRRKEGTVPSFQDADRRRSAAYDAYVRRLTNAWRDQDTPEPDDDPDNLMKRHLSTEPDEDTDSRRNAAWEQYRDRLSNAWKTDPRTASAIERQGEQWRGGR
jgi:hypothetical protein